MSSKGITTPKYSLLRTSYTSVIGRVCLKMIKLALLPGKSSLKYNGYTYEEEVIIYNDCLQFVIDNPRFVLDNMYKWRDFKVVWHNYNANTPVCPSKKHSFINKTSPISMVE